MGGDRIIGGSVAPSPSMIPWQVAVLDNDLIQFCGGTILDAFTILSAASCNISISHSVRAGSLIRNTGGQVNKSLFCQKQFVLLLVVSKNKLHIGDRHWSNHIKRWIAFYWLWKWSLQQWLDHSEARIFLDFRRKCSTCLSSFRFHILATYSK